jgi:hypothetical protein
VAVAVVAAVAVAMMTLRLSRSRAVVAVVARLSASSKLFFCVVLAHLTTIFGNWSRIAVLIGVQMRSSECLHNRSAWCATKTQKSSTAKTAKSTKSTKSTTKKWQQINRHSFDIDEFHRLGRYDEQKSLEMLAKITVINAPSDFELEQEFECAHCGSKIPVIDPDNKTEYARLCHYDAQWCVAFHAATAFDSHLLRPSYALPFASIGQLVFILAHKKVISLRLVVSFRLVVSLLLVVNFRLVVNFLLALQFRVLKMLPR